MIKNVSDKNDLALSLEKSSSCLISILNSFNQSDINKVPYEKSWTAAQVADHITRSNNSIIKALLLKGTAVNRNIDDRVEELKEVFLNFETKLKSPDFILPLQETYDKETVITLLKQSIEKLAETGVNADLSETINHPAFGDITKSEILHFVLYHTQRHIHQLEKIFRAVSDR